MAVDLVLAAEAESDIAEAYAWYERRRPGLGESRSTPYFTPLAIQKNGVSAFPDQSPYQWQSS
jgi:hypothetical protein